MKNLPKIASLILISAVLPLTANRTNVVLLETAPHWIQPIGTTELDARVAFGTVRFTTIWISGSFSSE